jgi:hypothetical protein
MVPIIMTAADRTILIINERVRICSFGDRGGFFNTLGSAGSNPRLCAGGPSIITFIHRICIGFNGLDIFSRVHIEINIRAAKHVKKIKSKLI